MATGVCKPSTWEAGGGGRVQGLRAVQLHGEIPSQNAEAKRKLCDLVLL